MAVSHAVSSAHIVAHAPPEQRNPGRQGLVAVGGVQAPVPLHVPAVPMLDRRSAEQEAATVHVSPA
jgi:hypothetical protein